MQIFSFNLFSFSPKMSICSTTVTGFYPESFCSKIKDPNATLLQSFVLWHSHNYVWVSLIMLHAIFWFGSLPVTWKVHVLVPYLQNVSWTRIHLTIYSSTTSNCQESKIFSERFILLSWPPDTMIIFLFLFCAKHCKMTCVQLFLENYWCHTCIVWNPAKNLQRLKFVALVHKVDFRDVVLGYHEQLHGIDMMMYWKNDVPCSPLHCTQIMGSSLAGLRFVTWYLRWKQSCSRGKHTLDLGLPNSCSFRIQIVSNFASKVVSGVVSGFLGIDEKMFSPGRLSLLSTLTPSIFVHCTLYRARKQGTSAWMVMALFFSHTNCFQRSSNPRLCLGFLVPYWWENV